MGSDHVRRHVPAMKRADLTAICDIAPAKMDPYPGDIAKFSSSKEPEFGSGLVDAVLIATPHYDHTTIGIDAFANGLHVLTEKPISGSQGRRGAIDRGRRGLGSSLRRQAMFQTRTSGTVQKLRQPCSLRRDRAKCDASTGS